MRQRLVLFCQLVLPVVIVVAMGIFQVVVHAANRRNASKYEIIDHREMVSLRSLFLHCGGLFLSDSGTVGTVINPLHQDRDLHPRIPHQL